MRVIIDRFENDYAICEKDNRQMINIEKTKVPPNAREGDVLDIEGNIIIINVEETQKRKKEIEELVKDIWS